MGRKLEKLLSPIIDTDEEILWLDKPGFVPFLFTGVPFLFIGVLWLILDYTLFLQGGLFFINPGVALFMLIHLFPFYGSVLNILRLLFSYQNMVYAMSNRRLIIRSGFWGVDFKIIDFDQIIELQVNVSLLENLLKVGTIRAYSGRTDRSFKSIRSDMIGIKNPYTVFKEIKTVSLDVKTDWSYPNKLRPETNSGYKTKLK